MKLELPLQLRHQVIVWFVHWNALTMHFILGHGNIMIERFESTNTVCGTSCHVATASADVFIVLWEERAFEARIHVFIAPTGDYGIVFAVFRVIVNVLSAFL
jgi:hypothetical protein